MLLFFFCPTYINSKLHLKSKVYAGDNNVGSNTCIANWRKESQIIIQTITEKRLFDQFVLLHFADIIKNTFSENSQNLTT